MTQTSTPDELQQRIQALTDRTAASRHIHSVIIGVENDDGAISIRTAAGDANSEDSYFIASITKMFTASIIMQLIDEQQLRLDDRVINLLPDVDVTRVHQHKGTDHTGDLELHHLLHQTSGLADYFADGFNEDFKRNRDHHYTVADIVDIARNAESNFLPDDRNGNRSAFRHLNQLDQPSRADHQGRHDRSQEHRWQQLEHQPLGGHERHAEPIEQPSGRHIEASNAEGPET